jgi:hypothetical protein
MGGQTRPLTAPLPRAGVGVPLEGTAIVGVVSGVSSKGTFIVEVA